MTVRARILVSLFVVIGGGFYFLINWIIEDIKPRYRQVIEESLIDTANLLGGIIEVDMQAGEFDLSNLREAFQGVYAREFSASIYGHLKNEVDLRVYLTDEKGIVIFDSEDSASEGQDYSRWNDVYRTLRGAYGARTTRDNPDDPQSTVLYVGAPLTREGEIVGSLTVCKPAFTSNALIATAQWKILVGSVVAALLVLLTGSLLTVWLTRPIQRLTEYARSIGRGERSSLPQLGRSEIGELGEAFEEMRDALEGKKYVEQYVQSLTHQIKSPLSSISGAVELLHEDMPADNKRKFLENIHSESARLQEIVEKLLELSALEARKGLHNVENVKLNELLEKELAALQPLLTKKELQIAKHITDQAGVKAEQFLLAQALRNILANAIEFSPKGGVLTVELKHSGSSVEISVEDSGPGLAEYAKSRVFDRFFSTPRPDTGRKGSGLGLSFVREIMALHGGEVILENRSAGGARARLLFPSSVVYVNAI